MDRDEILRLPDALKNAADRVAHEDGATLNQFVATAVAEKLSALKAARFFVERGARADMAAFDRLMSRQGGVPPSAEDLWEGDDRRVDPDASARGGDPLSPTTRTESGLDGRQSERDAGSAPLWSKPLLEAGLCLRCDMEAAALLSGRAFDPGLSDETEDRPASVLLARRRVRGALDAVGGPLSGVLIDLYGFQKTFRRIAVERNWSEDAARSAAQDALTELARYYEASEGRRDASGSVGTTPDPSTSA